MLALAVWSVFCIGLALIGAKPDKAMPTAGAAAIVWSVGITVWFLAGIAVASLQ